MNAGDILAEWERLYGDLPADQPDRFLVKGEKREQVAVHHTRVSRAPLGD